MLYTANKIGNVTLKNRWIMLAMHTGFATGNAFEEREFAFYEGRAKGGAAAITLVLGVNETGCLKGMHSATSLELESIKTLVARMHAHGCKVIVQLFHCGRNESAANHGAREMIAPSGVASSLFRAEPREMTAVDLEETKNDFVNAARFCKEAQVDILEISASAGYLLSEFLSPLSNLREDAYGMGVEGGMTFPLQVIHAVRASVKGMPLLLKVSGAQMVAGGYGLEATVDFCQKASAAIDGVTVTGGWHESPVEQISYHVSPGAYAPFAGMIKKHTKLPVIACNRIQDGEIAERLLEEGVCDFVGSARAFLADATFATKVAENEPFLPCQGCNHCIMGVLKGKEISCAFNPEVGQEYNENQRRKIATRKEVIVVGSGPGGMEAAKKAAERGFLTTIITKDATLGGQFQVASMPPKKQDIQKYISYMEHVLKALGVVIRYNEICDEMFLLEKKPYFTVLATGSVPTRPQIEGSDLGVFAKDVLNGEVTLPAQTEDGQIVIVGGGSVGLETAAFLKAQDETRKIKIVEVTSRFGKDLGALARPLLNQLKSTGVQLMADTKVDKIEENRVCITIGEQHFFLRSDAVIFATGATSVSSEDMAMALMNERLSYAVIGDAEEVGDGAKAIGSAYELFTRLYLA